jgi:signal transduction histidine kinase
MISSYNTGGIYSADLAWMFGCMITQGLIMDYRWGIASSIIVCSYLSFLYFSEYQLAINKNIFKQYIVKYGSTHYYFTWVFVVLLIAAIIGTFARVLFNANLKIEQLSNSKIDELEIRVKQKTDELSELRNRLARDFHDEMGNKLASINILSQSVALTMDNTAENQQTIKLLETISLRSKELFDGTKDFIWAIDFKSDYLFELYIYLREFGERFFNELEINFVSTSNFTNELLLLLPATSSRQLVLICKEIMTNAAKHSNCSQVDFSINFSDNMALISIQDNGLGFDVDAVNKRGLANMQKRLESINAKMEVLSNNEGTSIKIEIKTIKS